MHAKHLVGRLHGGSIYVASHYVTEAHRIVSSAMGDALAPSHASVPSAISGTTNTRHVKRPHDPHDGASSKRSPSHKRHKPHPTHFLALQLSQHPHAVAAATKVQAAVTDTAQHLQAACVEPNTLHVTLQVCA